MGYRRPCGLRWSCVRITEVRRAVRSRDLKFAAFVASFALIALSACSGPPSGIEPSPRNTSAADELWQRVVSQFPSAQRPEATVVREVGLSEWPAEQTRCLTEAGFEARVVDDSVSSTVPHGQEEAHALAQYVCEVSYPLRSSDALPQSDEQLRELYVYFVDELVPCLEGLGYNVGPVPSLTAFSERYYGEDPWTPYVVVGPMVPPGDFAAVSAACPQSPEP